MTIQGTLIDKKTGEPLYGAHIYMVRNDIYLPYQDITDMDGNFSNLGGFEAGDKIAFSYVGYGTQTFDNYNLGVFEMVPMDTAINEVTITAKKPTPSKKKKYPDWMYIGAAILLLVVLIVIFYYRFKK